jgi:hypothetical protein
MRTANSPFCIYLWRTADAPGALYIAKDFYVAQALCAALVDEGYLVRAVALEADVDYKITQGKLAPIVEHLAYEQRLANESPAT